MSRNPSYLSDLVGVPRSVRVDYIQTYIDIIGFLILLYLYIVFCQNTVSCYAQAILIYFNYVSEIHI